MKVFGIAGWKNSGKTGLMERLVTEISARGLTVSTIKHAHHDFDVDQPGKDSFRHRQAGAQEVLLASSRRWALMAELRGAQEPSLQDHLSRMSPVDLVLVEGFKTAGHQKLETRRNATRQPLLADTDPTICALACESQPKDASLPVLDLNDTGGIADFILAQTGLLQ